MRFVIVNRLGAMVQGLATMVGVSQMLKPPAGLPAGWPLEVVAGAADELHSLEVPSERLVRFHLPTRPSVVVGSAQPMESIAESRAQALGVEVTRRRSGGGAVWLAPGSQIWVDVVIPRLDVHWSEDVGDSANWLGEVWRSALATGEVWRSPLVGERPSAICFAGLGPGEVYEDSSDGPVKLVGISQRRTRGHARFQCIAYLEWDPGRLSQLLADPVDRAVVPRARAVRAPSAGKPISSDPRSPDPRSQEARSPEARSQGPGYSGTGIPESPDSRGEVHWTLASAFLSALDP